MPYNYYGYDYIIPICMKDDTYNFIGMQVKKSDTGLTSEIYKMQSRLHYVKCQNCVKFSGESCDKCTSDDKLKNIFGFQISLLISLDEDGEFGHFQSKTDYFEKCNSSENRMELKNTLKSETMKSMKIKRSRAKSFFEPLIHERKALNNNSMLSSTLWADEFVGLNYLTLGRKTINFQKDGMIHRQYCIVTRGLGMLYGLIGNTDSTSKAVNEILNPVKKDFNRKEAEGDSIPFIRNAIHDLSPSFMQYSNDLSILRTGQSILEQLDSFNNCILSESPQLKSSTVSRRT